MNMRLIAAYREMLFSVRDDCFDERFRHEDGEASPGVNSAVKACCTALRCHASAMKNRPILCYIYRLQK